MKFIKVRATGHDRKGETFDAKFYLNTDLIKVITTDGSIHLKEDGNMNVNNECLLVGDNYFNPIKIYNDINLDEFMRT